MTVKETENGTVIHPHWRLLNHGLWWYWNLLKFSRELSRSFVFFTGTCQSMRVENPFPTLIDSLKLSFLIWSSLFNYPLSTWTYFVQALSIDHVPFTWRQAGDSISFEHGTWSKLGGVSGNVGKMSFGRTGSVWLSGKIASSLFDSVTVSLFVDNSVANNSFIFFFLFFFFFILIFFRERISMCSVLRGLAGSSGFTSRNAYSRSKKDCENKK